MVLVGLLAAIVVVVVVGLGRAMEWVVGIYLPVTVLFGAFVGMFVLFVREGGKVYEDLYKRL